MALNQLLTWIPLAVAAAVAAIVLQFVAQIINYHFFHPLAQFPGPFWGGVTRIWIALQFYWGTELETQQKLHAKYGNCYFPSLLPIQRNHGLICGILGPVIRVTPTMLLVSDSKKLPEMYNRLADKSDYYISPSFGPVENILVTRDHNKHTQLRKVMAGPYSFSNIKKMEPLVDARVSRWLERLQTEFVDKNKPVDFTPWTV